MGSPGPSFEPAGLSVIPIACCAAASVRWAGVPVAALDGSCRISWSSVLAEVVRPAVGRLLTAAPSSPNEVLSTGVVVASELRAAVAAAVVAEPVAPAVEGAGDGGKDPVPAASASWEFP